MTDHLPDPKMLTLNGLPTYIIIQGKRRDKWYSVHEQEDGNILLIKTHDPREMDDDE